MTFQTDTDMKSKPPQRRYLMPPNLLVSRDQLHATTCRRPGREKDLLHPCLPCREEGARCSPPHPGHRSRDSQLHSTADNGCLCPSALFCPTIHKVDANTHWGPRLSPSVPEQLLFRGTLRPRRPFLDRIPSLRVRHIPTWHLHEPCTASCSSCVPSHTTNHSDSRPEACEPPTASLHGTPCHGGLGV